MIREITFAPDTYAALRTHLFPWPEERAALLLCGHALGAERQRLLVREVIPIESAALLRQESFGLRVDGRFFVPHVKRARAEGWSLVFVHSHPFQGGDFFSLTDLEGERELREFWHTRAPGRPHATLVLSPDGFAANWLESGRPAEPIDRIRVIGRSLTTLQQSVNSTTSSRHDRQIRAFGERTHFQLASASVAIVGLGGIGSLVAVALARLGLGSFQLWDSDKIEESNLSRVAGTNPTDAEPHRSKVDVAARLIRSINPAADVIMRPEQLHVDSGKALADVDYIFCCVDTHTARAELNRYARQYLTPVFNLGSRITTAPVGIYGAIDFLGPDGECLVCAGKVDALRVAQEQLGKEEAKLHVARGYLDIPTPEPAVISLNMAVVGVAITDFLRYLSGDQLESALVLDLTRSVIRRHASASRPCPECDATLQAVGDIPVWNGRPSS
ncbi:MAG TPA: ThiF family adenylyltransferase [Candidatus Limnocylindria bacterium]